MNRNLQAALFGVCASFALSANAFAQSTNATISGVVRDAQRATVAGATVTASQAQTGLSRQIRTSDTASYTLPNLPIGDYRVAVTAPGFKTSVIPSVTLQVDQNAELDFD